VYTNSFSIYILKTSAIVEVFCLMDANLKFPFIEGVDFCIAKRRGSFTVETTPSKIQRIFDTPPMEGNG